MTIEGIKKLKHSIGLDVQKPKRGKYVTNRNYYDAGKEKDPDLEQMVEEGYALVHYGHHNWYCVSEKGVNLLAEIIGIKIVVK